MSNIKKQKQKKPTKKHQETDVTSLNLTVSEKENLFI